MKKKNKPLGIRIELEEDAEALFLEAVEGAAFQPEKEREEFEHSAKSSVRRRKQKHSVISIDLHGFTLDEAKDQVRAQIDGHVCENSSPVTFRIITGKGIHSGPEGGVLVREIYDFVRSLYADRIVKIDESPSDVNLGGLPIRGHFNLTIN